MTKVIEVVDRYVAVWNEPDADRRRQGIAALWSEDAPREMVPAAGGAPAAVGFEFLVLGDDGRIRLDYQFLDRPPAP